MRISVPRSPLKHEKMSQRRPWLLLWFLPYIVFSVASDSFHTHDWSSTPSVASVAGARHTARVVAPHAALRSGGECFACDWAANSAAHVVVAPLAATTILVAAPASPFLFSLHAAPARSWRNRGPPLV